MKPAEFRVFLSSTFTDLQPEREQLVKKTFPRIRAKCRERGVEFTEIDLRWGITTEEAQSGKVVRICLEEIDRCRPYLIGILGSRYGWIPNHDDIEKDPKAMVQYPWLRKYVSEKKSITEMEIAHAVILNNPRDSSFFYEQTSNRHLIAASEIEPFNRLKNTLRELVAYREFDSPAELGEAVYNDLLSILDRDWPIKTELTPLEEVRIAHDAFALNRTRSYVANPEYYERFESFISSSDAPLVVWGKSGLGKSALMAYLSSEYAERNPKAFIVRHFVGAAAGASSAVDFMRHVMLEIRSRYELTDDLPTEETIYAQEFPSWLAKVKSDETLVLVVDAVNQLSGIGPELHWLPEFIPANVRLVISTTPELPLEQLRKRDHSELEIKPLDATQRKRISEEFLARYHKHLSKEQIEGIAEEATLDSPLFLRTILEELRVFGLHQAMDKHLANYLASETEAELFQKVLSRMERDYGVETVRSIMTAIWASRFGLTETELIGVTHLSRLALSEFLIALEFHLMQRGGLYTFFHNYLREAVEIRYIASIDQKQKAHYHLGDYFSTREYSDRRRDEEPWQWQQAESWDKYKECLTDIELLENLLDESKRHELIRFWTILKEHYPLGETYHDAFVAFEHSTSDPARSADIASKLGEALVAASIYPEAEYLLKHGLAMRRELFGGNDLESAQSMNDLGTLFYHTGNFKEAEPLFRSAVEIREAILGKTDPKAAKSLNDLGAILYAQGKLDEAEDCFKDALARYQEYYKRDHPEIASTLNNLGSVLHFKKEYNKAIDFLNLSLEMYERLHGKNHITLTTILSNLGLDYTENRDYVNAEKIFLRALQLNITFYGKFDRNVSELYLNLGIFYSKILQHRKAIEMHKEGIAIKNKLLGDNHYETVNAYLSLGISLYKNGDIVRAKELRNFFLPMQKKILGESHPAYKVQENAWSELLNQEQKKPKKY